MLLKNRTDRHAAVFSDTVSLVFWTGSAVSVRREFADCDDALMALFLRSLEAEAMLFGFLDGPQIAERLFMDVQVGPPQGQDLTAPCTGEGGDADDC